MAHFIILYLSAFGLGEVLFWKYPEQKNINGLKFYLGFLCIPIFSYLGNGILNIPLSLMAQIIASISLWGVGYKVLLGASNLADKRPLREIIHPVYVLFGLVVILKLIFFPADYEINRWDEFTHWLLMPKQIFFANTMVSHEMPFLKFIRYTPGWPLILDYPQFILESVFNEAPVQAGIYVSGIGILSIYFDFFKTQAMKFKLPNAALLSWILIILFELLDLPDRMFAGSILIEKPLRDCIAALFVFSFTFLPHKKYIGRNNLFLTLILVAGFLFKKPFLAVMPVFLVFYALCIVKNKSISISKKIMSFAIPITFLGFFVWHWNFLVSDFKAYWDMAGGHVASTFWQVLTSVKAQSVFPMLTKRIFIHLLKNPLSYFCFFSFFYWRKNKDFKWMIRLVLWTFLFYIISLYWTYLAILKSYESSYLASFKRYFGMLEGPVFTVGVVLFLLLVFKKIKLSRAKLKILIICLLFLCLAKIIRKDFYFLKKYRTASIIARDYKVIKNVIATFKLDHPTVQILDTNDNGSYRVALRYQAISTNLRPDFDVNWVFSYDGFEGKSGQSKVTKEEFINLLKNTKLILPFHPTPWATSILQEFVFDPNCLEHFSDYVLMNYPNNGSLEFRCLLKSRYLD